MRVHGDHFASGLRYACRFGGVTAHATFVSRAELSCTSPAGVHGEAALEGSVNAVNFTEDALPFLYHEVPLAAAVSPAGGPTQGGSVVLVSGHDFSSGSDYRCRFGESVVRAELKADGNLSCVSPSAEAAGDATVEVSLNGQQYSRSAVQFAYHSPVQVLSLSPSTGLVGGHTLLRVLGDEFQPFDDVTGVPRRRSKGRCRPWPLTYSLISSVTD